MLAGISTACLYPQNTEEVLTILAENGVESTEVFINSASEMQTDYVNELRRIADSGGVRVLSVHPFTSGMEPMLFFSKYQRRFEDGREFYKRYYETAGLLGADIVVFHGNLLQLKIEPEEYFERFAILLEDARREGMRLCHENVCRCTGRSPDFFRQLADALPQAEFVFDIKQAVRSEENVMDFAKAMGKNIAHVHISDHDESRDCLSIGHGSFNIPEFLNYMQTIGFTGGMIVEVYRHNILGFVELFGGYQQLSHQISTLA